MEVDKPEIEVPENPQIGYYDLKAIVTHKGRALSSGHYMGYAKDEKDGKWIKFDDDDVYEVAQLCAHNFALFLTMCAQVAKEEILKLNGGGDWDMAYICVYKVHNQLP